MTKVPMKNGNIAKADHHHDMGWERGDFSSSGDRFNEVVVGKEESFVRGIID